MSILCVSCLVSGLCVSGCHTQVNLPDDRVIIVSGFLDDPVRQTGKPAPSIDVFDYKSKRCDGVHHSTAGNRNMLHCNALKQL